ncbi:hypothetical protein EN836_08365 [Mesorhizobium sp. M1C.F.Ca.ET.193.01.1.1]|uniref:hypothetical protein n=3 Tax=Mesorhizobium TaxID=68287 RepID=UPI000FD1964A|nr:MULTISPECIES: hypothetical protein [unclassified Mesorhizobium]TGT02342.1 hypothetical protein EN820_24735 [bacterium M00.F.Ca.ET.177.01.1.1]RWA76254.1 MAG: hypothetical protein EOQ28_05260 [Mesorhizobium sp.]RWC03949.1 MAG: hypothetical protein EOQ57_06050 [Mesorhizobium sp.]RWG87210.1 MAG: hypothetical protein EOQ69_03150 [Mesorhizobium sp.]RWK07613.1 MAG: hypothetical protein EOR39_21615 [Mesorhizobium sp.]
MKKRTDASQIVIKSVPGCGDEAGSSDARLTSFSSTVNKAAALLGQWSVAEAVEVAKALWPDEAATVVAWSALSAHCEGEALEYRFWFEVFMHLQAGSSNSDLQGIMEGAQQYSFH